MEKVNANAPHFAYMISPRDPAVGGGWRLQCFENGLDVKGAAFPAREGRAEDQAYLDAMDEGEEWLLSKALRQIPPAAPVQAGEQVARFDRVTPQADGSFQHSYRGSPVPGPGRAASPRPATGNPDLPLYITLQLVGDAVPSEARWEARCNKSAGMFMNHKTPHAALSALLAGIGIKESATAPVSTGGLHPDDIAVDLFATVMKVKMAKSREKGRDGWADPALCTAEVLNAMLVEHLSKGDPIDIATFAMMLWNRGERTTFPTAPTAECAATLPNPPEGLAASDWDGSLWAYSGNQMHDYGDKCFRAGMEYARRAANAGGPASPVRNPIANGSAIPPMTDPLGRHWRQPADIREAPMDDTHVLLSPRQVAGLAEYSSSYPSGTYDGKCWKREGKDCWYLCWYQPHPTPGKIGIGYRIILEIAPGESQQKGAPHFREISQ